MGAPNEIKAFCIWFGSLPHTRKILIAGNHDLSLQKEGYANRAAAKRTKIRGGAGEADNVSDQCLQMIQEIPNCEYLLDSGTSVRGI